ncbi:hypothetical protein O181_075320 [Austropuccinia psidii MF-1]|uniref:Uncharacterized protein n=1 Tax=Austropuccinia psidii MF-1 TaxID=1389203 RepID=A0A9Q3F6F5_9BASI|nr:hypothetical protein [Austropuccinia psidii MF-1]
MSPVCLRNLGIPSNQPEDRQGMFRARRPGTGHLRHSSESKDTEGNNTILPFTSQFNRNLKPEDWKHMDQVL